MSELIVLARWSNLLSKFDWIIIGVNLMFREKKAVAFLEWLDGKFEFLDYITQLYSESHFQTEPIMD